MECLNQIDRIIWQFINYVLVVKNVYLHINDFA